MSQLNKLFSAEKKRRLAEGLQSSKRSFFSKLGTAVAGRTRIDEALLDELEGVLIQSDVGVTTTVKIIEAIERRVAADNTSDMKLWGNCLPKKSQKF